MADETDFMDVVNACVSSGQKYEQHIKGIEEAAKAEDWSDVKLHAIFAAFERGRMSTCGNDDDPSLRQLRDIIIAAEHQNGALISQYLGIIREGEIQPPEFVSGQ